MNYYKASKKIILGIDIFTITISFVLVYLLRFRNLLESSRSTELTSMYVVFFVVTSALYAVIFMSRGKPVLERQSYKEIWFDVTRQQFFLMSFFVLWRQRYSGRGGQIPLSQVLCLEDVQVADSFGR